MEVVTKADGGASGDSDRRIPVVAVTKVISRLEMEVVVVMVDGVWCWQ